MIICLTFLSNQTDDAGVSAERPSRSQVASDVSAFDAKEHFVKEARY